MKKIALSLAAVAALGVAACNPANNEANMADNATDMNLAGSEAIDDVNMAANDAAAVNATDDALDNAASDVGNVASDAGNSISNGANAVENAAGDAAN